VTPLDSIVTGKEKLEQKTINFEKLEESGLKDGKWDTVYITLVLMPGYPASSRGSTVLITI
jgi:hypothetical protein